MNTRIARQLKFCLFGMTLLVAFGSVVAHADPSDKYKKHPGYVDFESLGSFDDMEMSIEVFLKGSLIKLAREAVRYDEPELADILEKIELVRVNVFPLKDEQGEAVTKKMTELSKNLEKKGWEIAVRVREEDENVYVYTLPGSDDSINGLVVMVVEFDRHGRSRDHEFTFVNIVGSIKPEDVGRLGRAIDINGVDLDDIYDDHGRRRKH